MGVGEESASCSSVQAVVTVFVLYVMLVKTLSPQRQKLRWSS